jgi:hypothetical protein
MTDKFEMYDVLSVLIPGTLLVGLIPLCFPAVVHVTEAKFPSAFAVLLLTGLAVFLGFIVQALSSFIEPLLEYSWGGRPSRRIFSEGLGLRYLGIDEANRVKQKLVLAAGPGQSDTAIFRYASQLSDAASVGRCTRFNGLYAYHRSLLTATMVSILLFSTSIEWGAAVGLSMGRVCLLLIGACLLTVLLWHRTKQRSLYFAAEILLTSERVLDDLARANPATSATESVPVSTGDEVATALPTKT